MHVRQLLTKLSYSSLLQNGLLPDLHITCTERAKHYPLRVHQHKAYSVYGMYVDYMVRKMIQYVVSNIDFGSEPLITDINWINKYTNLDTSWQDIAHETLNMLLDWEQITLDYNMWNETDHCLQYISKKVAYNFKPYVERFIRYNVEYNIDTVQGQHNLVIDDMILDIKTTCNFAKMQEDSLLQIWCYLTLTRANGEQISYIGIFSPLQGIILKVDVSTFDTSTFLLYLLGGHVKTEIKDNLLKNVDTHLGKTIVCAKLWNSGLNLRIEH